MKALIIIGVGYLITVIVMVSYPPFIYSGEYTEWIRYEPAFSKKLFGSWSRELNVGLLGIQLAAATVISIALSIIAVGVHFVSSKRTEE